MAVLLATRQVFRNASAHRVRVASCSMRRFGLLVLGSAAAAGLALPRTPLRRRRSVRGGADASPAVKPFSAELKPQRASAKDVFAAATPRPARGRKETGAARARRRGGGVPRGAEIVECARAVPIVARRRRAAGVRSRQGVTSGRRGVRAGTRAHVGLRRAALDMLRARVVRLWKALRAVDVRVITCCNAARILSAAPPDFRTSTPSRRRGHGQHRVDGDVAVEATSNGCTPSTRASSTGFAHRSRQARDGRRPRRRLFQTTRLGLPHGVHGRADLPRASIDGVGAEKALRHVPIFTNCARDLLRLCPLDRRVGGRATGATTTLGSTRPHARRRVS